MNRNDLWLVFAGFIASSVNAAAGGGTLLSFPSLLAAGLSPLAANATSTVGLLPGSFASIWAYRNELKKFRGDLARILWPSLVGGVLGAWLLIFLSEKVFATIVPGLLLLASGLLVLQPLVSRWLKSREAAQLAAAGTAEVKPEQHGDFRFGVVPVLAGTLVVSIYAGYFGAGAGILFLSTMALLLARPLDEVNAIKVVMAFVSNGVAALTFAVLELQHPRGALQFRSAAPLAVGSILGGYLGVRLVRRLPPAALRAFAAAVGIGIAIYLAVRK